MELAVGTDPVMEEFGELRPMVRLHMAEEEWSSKLGLSQESDAGMGIDPFHDFGIAPSAYDVQEREYVYLRSVALLDMYGVNLHKITGFFGKRPRDIQTESSPLASALEHPVSAQGALNRAQADRNVQ